MHLLGWLGWHNVRKSAAAVVIHRGGQQFSQWKIRTDVPSSHILISF